MKKATKSHSSYEKHDYMSLISALVRLYKPKTIIEFGVLDGFSLQTIIANAPPDAQIAAYDIFEDFNGNHANRIIMENKFPGIVTYGDFYQIHKTIQDNTIDMFHIDIANTGETYSFFFDHYLKKLSQNGFAILEGGSVERDNYYWMIKYNKPKIRPVLGARRHQVEIFTFDPFPSITIVKKEKEMRII